MQLILNVYLQIALKLLVEQAIYIISHTFTKRSSFSGSKRYPKASQFITSFRFVTSFLIVGTVNKLSHSCNVYNVAMYITIITDKILTIHD